MRRERTTKNVGFLLTLVFFILAGPFTLRASAQVTPDRQDLNYSPAVVTSPPIGVSGAVVSQGEVRLRSEWRMALVAHPAPKEGCYKARFPDTHWEETPCSRASRIPYGQHHGGKPYLVGNGAVSDFAAQLNTTTITSAFGSFDSVSTGITEQGISGLTGEMSADTYSLQLNTNTFPAALCSGALGGAPCRGWEQIIYADHGSSAELLIQYWLLAYNKSCPSGWTGTTYTLQDSNEQETDCWINSDDSAVTAPPIGVSSLQQASVAGSITSTSNAATLIMDTNAFTVVGKDLLGAEKGWVDAEYNIFGDGNSTEATFGADSSITVRTAVNGVIPQQPICDQTSYTGETNNLSLSGIPQVEAANTYPSISFIETNQARRPAGCASGSGTGTLQWISGQRFVDWANDRTGLNYYTVGGAMCVIHAPNCGLGGHNGKDHFFAKGTPLPAGVNVVGVAYQPFWPPNIHKTDRGSLGSQGSYGEDADPVIQSSDPLFSVEWQNACQATSSGDYTGDWSRLNNTYQVSFLVSVQNGSFVDGAVPYSSVPPAICAQADRPPAGVSPNTNTFPQSASYPVSLTRSAPANGGYLPWEATFPAPGLVGTTPISSWTVQSISNSNKFEVFLVKVGRTSDECFTPAGGTKISAGQAIFPKDITTLYGTDHLPIQLVACTTGPVPAAVFLTVNYEE